jgi:hypothetical protein
MESGYDSLLYFLNITIHVQFKPNLVYLSSTVLVKRIFIQKQKQKQKNKYKTNQNIKYKKQQNYKFYRKTLK